MLQVAVAFDPELPFVAARAFPIGDESFLDGKSFPWRDLGIDLHTLHSLYRSGFVRCERATAPAEAQPTAPQPSTKRRR